MSISTSHTDVKKIILYTKVKTYCRYSINFECKLHAKINFKCKFKGFYKQVSESKGKVEYHCGHISTILISKMKLMISELYI